MKNSIALILFLAFPLFSQAANLSCKNTGEVFTEDTLEFYDEGSQTYAYYFNNDSYESIPCEVTPRDGYFCQNGNYTVMMDEDGYASVWSRNDPEIEFNCY